MRDYALNANLSENEFWTMTIPEVNRYIKAWGWREKRQQQFAAGTLYQLPTLIAIGILDGKKYPEIYEVFPSLFDKEEIEEAKRRNELEKSRANFMAWAESFNKKFERNE